MFALCTEINMNIEKITLYLNILGTVSGILWVAVAPGVESALVVSLLVVGLLLKFGQGRIDLKEENEGDTITSKMKLLNTAETSMKDLLKYIEQQREELTTRETKLVLLKEEHEELEKIVNTNKEVVEAMLCKSAQKSRKYSIYGRLITFIFGIVTSVVGAFIYSHFIEKIFA
jgi:hypothetical protein